MDKLPYFVKNNYKQHPTDLQKSRLEHMRRNSLRRSRHRMQSEVNNSRARRFDARWLRNHRTLDHLRDTEYYDVSLYFDLSAPARESLDVYTDWILTELNEEDIGIEPIRFRNEDALETTSIVGSDLLQHRIRFDLDTTSKVIIHFTCSHREPSEEYRNTQLDRLEKYIKKNDNISLENGGEYSSDETQK